MTISEILPPNWTRSFARDAPIGIGYDIATTEKGMSNPAAIAVTQRISPMFRVRSLLRWKSGNASVHEAIFMRVIDDLIKAGLRPRAASIDASNEVFFAQNLRKKALGKCPVYLIKSGEKINWRGADSIYKVLMGNILATYAEDNMLALPNEPWIVDDFRLVKRDRGSFMTELGENGEHGDTFDAVKHSIWALEGIGGNQEAEATSITNFSEGEWDDPLDAAMFGGYGDY
jgi:hypothetical protein